MAFVPVSYSGGGPVLASDGTARVACAHLAQWLQVFDALQVARGRGHVTYYQTVGGADASAGTHLCGSAWDMAYTSDAAIADAREMGAAIWHRQPGVNGWPSTGADHCHGLISCGDNACNAYQYTAYWLGYNGLGLNGVGAGDPLPKPSQRRTWQQGITWAQDQIAQSTKQEDYDMGSYVFMRTTDGTIWLLAPGRAPQGLSPQQWQLWVRLGALLKGGDFNRAEVDIVSATLQPAPVDVPQTIPIISPSADEIATAVRAKIIKEV